MNTPGSADLPCPCCSGLAYGVCCRPYHGGAPATTPEVLMRSRYTAYVLGEQDYLLQTWHPSTRPAELDLHGMPRWSSLQILSSRQQGNDGQVHFRAIHRIGGKWGYLEEVSDFIREQERWFYLTGEPREGQLKPGRNDRCPCGSGRKYKSCCR